MTRQSTQNLANHVKIPWLFMILALGYVAAAAFAIVGLCFTGTIVGTCLIGTGLLLMAVLGVALVIMTRAYALTLQDRVIRLEMRVRLERVLPDDLKEAARGLALGQLIALRFASDAELPDLVRQVMEGKLTAPGDIKKSVKDWQADHQRV